MEVLVGETERPDPESERCSYGIKTCRRAAGSGVRASIVAMKAGNSAGAKGRRLVDVSQKRAMQETPASVPRTTGTQQAGEPNPRQARRLRWCWSEASIWTDRMLAALETGVKRDVWFSLIDKVFSLKNPCSSWSKTARNNGAAGMDGMTIERYEKEVEANPGYLSEPLKAGTFQPRPIRRTHPQARRHAASAGDTDGL